MGLVRCPVCTFDSWDLVTVSNRDGCRKQVNDWRVSTDIDVEKALFLQAETGYRAGYERTRRQPEKTV